MTSSSLSQFLHQRLSSTENVDISFPANFLRRTSRRRDEFSRRAGFITSAGPKQAPGPHRRPDPPPLFIFDERIQRITPRPPPPRPRESSSGVEHLDFIVPSNHRSGYVAIIGRPNAGKSTLLNALVGQKLAIVTQKPQTTRHRILAISSTDDSQVILYDTPGVMMKANHKLDEVMMGNVRAATVNADAIIVVVDSCLEPEKVVDMVAEAATAAAQKRPLLLVLNKRDLLKPGELAKKVQWFEANTDADDILTVSARFGHGVNELRKWAVSKLPLGPAYYPKDIVSEHPERFFVAEIVREKILLQYSQEIPYVSQVNVTMYVERDAPAKDYICLEIVVERNSQKGIIVGKGGAALKALATAARLDIEEFVGRKVFIEIFVKVKEKWREDEKLLQEYGIDNRKQR